MKKVPNKPTHPWCKQKDSGPCTQFVLRHHLHMAVTWVTLRPCPFTRPGPRGRAVGRTHHPAGKDRSEVPTDRCGLASRYPHSNGHHELGKVSPSPETVLLQRTRVRSACAPSSVRSPFRSWRWAAGYVRVPPPRPSALPSFPNLPGLCGMSLGWFPPRRPPVCTFLFPGSEGEGTREQACAMFARGDCYLRSTPAAPSPPCREASCHSRSLVTIDGLGCFVFLLELARRGSEKAAGRLEHLPTPLHLQPFWAPKVRSPTLRGPTRGRSPRDTLTLSWD